MPRLRVHVMNFNVISMTIAVIRRSKTKFYEYRPISEAETDEISIDDEEPSIYAIAADPVIKQVHSDKNASNIRVTRPNKNQ